MQGLDVLKVHERPFQKLQNVGRSVTKVLKLYEQYFLYFLKVENKATTYVCSGRPVTYDAHCKKHENKARIQVKTNSDYILCSFKHLKVFASFENFEN